jgi:4-amino-4-deoxy-L-arabinose transferase-like glycosyltransferase
MIETPNAVTTTTTSAPTTRWRLSSLVLIFLPWLVLQFGGLFSPGLLDDVDSIYIQIAREMLQRHDFVTPTIDGIRFFDKPPLMYWMAAGSMRLFGVHDWAARLPLALGVLALLLAVYALGNRLFSAVSPTSHHDRGGLYAALALGTSLGPYLYTRFFIPDILIALWMTLSVHLFLIALDRIREDRSALLPSLGFGAVLALNVLTKGLIGIVFPVLFVLLYLAFTRNILALLKLHLPAATGTFLLLAAPWHILAALRNPPVPMPAGIGLPAHAGWAWFYLYNEHVARFLGRRIPHDYGQVPVPLFWLLLLLWLLPWVAFLPAALIDAVKSLRNSADPRLRLDSDIHFSHEDSDTPTPGAPFMSGFIAHERDADAKRREAALSLLLWPGIILGFFTLSSRQEYYHLPALPALALLVGGLLAAADRLGAPGPDSGTRDYRKQALRGSLYFLVPLGTLLFLICSWFALTAPAPHPGVTLTDVLTSNPANYNLSLGHLFDLTGAAMGFFRGPLIAVALGMLTLGPIAYLVRKRGHTLAANLLIAAAMTAVLLAAHEGLARFYPILGSKDLALAVAARQQPGDILILDGEMTSGSTLLFYTPQTGQPVLLLNGRVNTLWFGSFWPDAPNLFPTEDDLRRLWQGPHRVFLFTYAPRQRTQDLKPFAPVIDLAHSGGKTILTNKP